VIEVSKAVPAGRLRLPSSFRSRVAPGLALLVLTACGGHGNPPQVMTTADVPANTDSTLNSIANPNVMATFSSFAPQQGEALTTVALSGAGFTTTKAITLNGVYATTWTLNSDNLLTLQVPANASTGPIMVITTLEGTQVSATNFTVLPQITAITPASGPAGTVVALSGSGFVGTTRVTIGGELAAGPGSSFSSPTNANQLTVIVGHDATTGPVTLTASGVTVEGPTFTVTAD